MKLTSLTHRVLTALCGVLAVAMILGNAAYIAAKEQKVNVALEDLPEVISEAIEAAYPKGKIIRIEKEVVGEDPGQYDFDIRLGKKYFEVEVSPGGDILESKQVARKARTQTKGPEKAWTRSFGEEHCTFSSVGKNRFFSLQPGSQLVLESPSEKVVITVLDETKEVGGIETRVVEEREEEDGELKEVSRNFFAICREHGDVFYFGEEVEDYKDGKIVGHSGAWSADDRDSKAGIIMPGTILLGARHYQELAPNAMDRAEVVAVGVTLKTPAGTFKDCIRVEETSAIDPNDKCYKTYAPGVGLIQDEDLLLTSYREASP